MFSAFNPSKCTHTWSSGHTHTPGAVDTHTQTHTWSSGHTHTPGAVDTHTPGAVDTHTHTHLEQWTQTHTWSSWGFGALLKGLTSVVGNSNPQPRGTSPTLYPLEPRLPQQLLSLTGNRTRAVVVRAPNPNH